MSSRPTSDSPRSLRCYSASSAVCRRDTQLPQLLLDIVDVLRDTVPALSVAVAVVYGLRQLRHNARSREQQALQKVFEDMVTDERYNRRTRVMLNKKPLEDWDPEEIRDAERELERFQQLGFFVRHNFLRPRLILEMYSILTIRMWDATEPFIQKERDEMGAANFAGDFEKLAERCRRYRLRKGFSIDGIVARRSIVES